MKANIKSQIKTILSEIPETRNSDITLMIEVWKRFYPSKVRKGAAGEYGVWLKDLYDLPREDNVKRIRAKYNEQGDFLPTEWKIAKARGIEEDRWCKALGFPVKAQTQFSSKKTSYMDKPQTLFKVYLVPNEHSC